jgi:amino acid adenylation domain-containing protein
VAAQPRDAIAVELDEERWSYRDLSARASRVAAWLVASGASGGRVGLSLPRSIDLVVGVLAVLEAGASCLPLDANDPDARRASILEEAKPRLVLTGEMVREAVERGGPPHATEVHREHEAYVMYTSGSTGRPKGVRVPHRVLANLVECHLAALGGGRRTLQLAPLSFDVSFYELFTTLAGGGTLVLCSDAQRTDPAALAALIDRAHIEKLMLPPLLLEALAAEPGLASLAQVISTGDRLRATRDVVRLFERLPGCRLHNHYGPTETHVATTYALPASPGGWPALPPIGRPIANAQAWVLDLHGEPVPIGALGLLHLGGACVADGYVARPSETAQRFAGGRYATGDVVRWNAEGELEFLGRRDAQVKIRGHRVETGEIEAVLLEHPEVEQAAVIADAGELRAYLVAQSVADDALRAHLAQKLPRYMIPSSFVRLPSLPRTPNGKLDRRGLQESEGRSYVAPRNEVEAKIAEIFAALLRLPRVGAHDNFFEIGGHSLSATQAALRISRAFGIKLLARRVFEEPVVEGLARVVAAMLPV